MKLYSFFIAVFMVSGAVYSAQATNNAKTDRPGFIESRQNKAREIMKENFRSVNQLETKEKKKSDFGFHKARKEKTQNI